MNFFYFFVKNKASKNKNNFEAVNQSLNHISSAYSRIVLSAEKYAEFAIFIRHFLLKAFLFFVSAATSFTFSIKLTRSARTIYLSGLISLIRESYISLKPYFSPNRPLTRVSTTSLISGLLSYIALGQYLPLSSFTTFSLIPKI